VDLLEILTRYSDENYFDADAAEAFLDSWIEADAPNNVPQLDDGRVEHPYLRQLSNQLSSGQSKSCAYLMENLSNKLHVLKCI
jgi:hypothetical protein